MEKVKITDGLYFSKIIHGQMRIPAWNLSSKELLNLMEELIDIGIDTFDNADIYGNYSCEELVGDALKLQPSLRKKMTLITKCGIKILSDKFKDRKIQHYEYSYEYIIQAVENSLKNMQTDYIDVLLLHRPSYLLHPEEVAEAFSKLKKEGKIRFFGVSNFLSHDFSLLQSYLDEKLVTNQIELSPYEITHLENGDINFLLEKRVRPTIYSPMAHGKLIKPDDEKSKRVIKVLHEVAEEMNVDGIDKIIYAWISKLPSQAIPINGSGNIERIKRSLEALDLKMSTEQWARILVAARGKNLA